LKEYEQCVSRGFTRVPGRFYSYWPGEPSDELDQSERCVGDQWTRRVSFSDIELESSVEFIRVRFRITDVGITFL
ncbi:hypothetical protein T10_2458, partial [Trichinella papuae]